jgi:GxxExxY protein
MNVTDVTRLVTDAATKIHTAIGPGCFEKTYEEALYHELSKTGLQVERGVIMPVLYERLVINDAFKVSLLVDQQLVIEIKTVDHIMAVHFKLVKSFLRLLKLKNGMLLNFRTDSIKDGIHRILNEPGQ